MANYSDIKGFTVQTVSSDPAASRVDTGSFSSGGSLNTPRGNAGASGLQTAALYFGGDGPAGPAIANTEQYDGSSWTEVNDLNVARGQQFFSNQGTQTAALSATGSPVQTSVESWNGSSWTETTDLNTARRNGASLGTQTAMVGTGGWNGSAYVTLTEIWNGSSWTETGDCPDAKFVSRGGGGTTTAGIIAGSYPNGDVDSSQTWDGSTWTDGPNINTGRSGIAFSAASQSSALGHGGGVGTPQAAQTKTEFFDGTSWTELADLSTASQQGGGAGNSTTGIHYGGYGPGALTTTEEWTTTPAETFQKTVEGQLFFNSTANAFKETITDLPGATWSTGGSLNTARGNNPSSTGGTQTAAMLAGGGYPTSTANTELYNGSSWTEVNNLNQARSNAAVGGTSTLTVLGFGYIAPSPGNTNNTETWDGTNWTAGNAGNTSRSLVAGFGVYNSAVATGGTPGTSNVESWNGTSWTEIAEINSARYAGAAAGSSNTDGLFFGGSPEPAGVTKNEQWDGSSWTELGDMNQAKVYHAGCGTSTSALAFGGQSSSQIANNEAWNGTAWTELADLASARNTLAGAGSTSAALAYGGGSPGNATEEFTASLANKTITAS